MRRPSRFLARRLAQATCAAVFTFSSPALSTYSLIATDSESGEMGGLVVSCVGDDFDLANVLRLDNNYILVAQGYFFDVGRDELVSELAHGASPEEALTAALSPDLDPSGSSSGPTYRQYAALTLEGAVAQHSGRDLSPFAGHQAGSLGSLTYALQGNILTGSSVLDRLEEGFLAPQATIAARSISALSALADSGGGDSRCSPLSGDAGYFVRRAPNAPSFEVSVRSLEEGEEVARALGISIEEKLAELSVEAPPTGTTIPDEETDADPHTETSGGCDYSQGGRSTCALLVSLAGLLLGARRRTTLRRS